jgi:hypothetical protein
MKVKDAFEEHRFCGSLVNNSPSNAVPELDNENLQEDLELIAFFKRTRLVSSAVHS